MKKRMKFLSAILLLLFAFAAVVKPQVINPKAEILSGSEKIVRGAPFSAEAISESVQILFDGNRITQRTASRLYRDGAGRFRRDEMPKPVGIGSFVEMPQMIFILDPVANFKFYLYPESKTARQSVILNPLTDKRVQIAKSAPEVAKLVAEIAKAQKEVFYAQQDFEKLRQELEKRKPGVGDEETKKIRLEFESRKKQVENLKARIELLREQFRKLQELIKEPQEDTRNALTPDEKKVNKQTTLQPDAKKSSTVGSADRSVVENEKPTKAVPQSETIKKPTPAMNAVNPKQPNNPALPVLPKGEVKNESLGTRRIEGVEAEGVRMTTTIRAGAIGNDRPLEIVYERWFSKELQLIIFSEYRDPRFGEQTYRLINIKREEPDGALFTLPADYKVVNKPEKKLPAPRKKAA
jgi:hypothetical protein